MMTIYTMNMTQKDRSSSALVSMTVAVSTVRCGAAKIATGNVREVDCDALHPRPDHGRRGADGARARQDEGEVMVKIKLVITREPTPPPIPSFVCVVCEAEIERDPYNPDWQKPPICMRCAYSGPRPRLAHVPHEHWGDFFRATALIHAIKKEASNVRRTH